jgi:hypothetical protein
VNLAGFETCAHAPIRDIVSEVNEETLIFLGRRMGSSGLRFGGDKAVIASVSEPIRGANGRPEVHAAQRPQLLRRQLISHSQ